MKRSNRHPVDQLADVREQMKVLKSRETELREMILGGESDVMGDDHEAYVQVQTQERVDVAKLKRELGMRALRPFIRTLQIPFVRVRSRAQQ